MGGGADTSSLCGRVVAWDLATEIDTHHLAHCCQKCAAILARVDLRPSHNGGVMKTKPLGLFQVIILCLALGPGLALALGAGTSTVTVLFWCCIPVVVAFLVIRNHVREHHSP
jgi:hypothetical protein